MRLSIGGEGIVGRPVEDVFHFVAVDHCSNHPRWDPHVIRIEPPPSGMGPGAQLTIVRRTMGREESRKFVVSAWEAPLRMTIATQSPNFDLSLSCRCEPLDAQRTRFVLTGDVRVSGTRAFLAPLMKARFGAEIRQNLARIREMVEAASVKDVPPAQAGAVVVR